MTQQTPIFILPEGTTRTMGKDAQRNNIMAAKLVSETVRSTLGPKGMDKMIVDSIGDITITNDGVTILNEMQIEHPAAKMMVEIAKTQESQVGDGTTTAVILAGELLKNAERLLDQNIHPTVIAKGYRIASEKAQKILNNIAEPIAIKDEDLLKKIAMTAMVGKGAETAKEKLSDIAVAAVKQVANEDGTVSMDDIKIEKKIGGGIEDSEFIKGILLDKEKVHVGMPKIVKNAKIALIDSALEIKNPETDTKIQISDPSQLKSFIEQEERMLREMADKIIKSGATVVVCQKGIDDMVQHFLSKAKIYAVRRVKQSDMAKLARATGGTVVTNLNDLTSKDLGSAGIVEEQTIGDEQMTYVTECKNAKSVTFLVQGGTEHVADEAERAVKDAIGGIIASLKCRKVVAGAGASEVEVARQVREFANSLSGREQLAVLAFADSVEIVPRTLAENAGIDPIDMLTELKSEHEKGRKWAGLDVLTEGKVVDAWGRGIIEPLKIKTQALKSASEVSEMILRIDDVIAGGSSKMPPMPHGMPPGGEMY